MAHSTQKSQNRTNSLFSRRGGTFLPAPRATRAAVAGATKALLVVAHPDDEYAVAATVYRLTRELGATVDQVVITDGAGGYRYSALAEEIYGFPLTDEATGRKYLPEIRRRETLASGRILGIRRHHFLGEADNGFTLDPNEAELAWDIQRVRGFLTQVMESEQYQFVFTLLPARDTHGHHQMAATLALDAAQALPEERRPVVLGADPGVSGKRPAPYRALPGRPHTRAAAHVWEFPRTRRFGFREALDYRIIVNWVIAEHKSQGYFQTDVGRHDVERFWVFASAGSAEWAAASMLFSRLLHADSGLPAAMHAQGA